MVLYKSVLAFVVVITFIINVNCVNNPYKALGVKRKDSQETIKKAYKMLALKW